MQIEINKTSAITTGSLAEQCKTLSVARIECVGRQYDACVHVWACTHRACADDLGARAAGYLYDSVDRRM
jgi:hypothetical protein